MIAVARLLRRLRRDRSGVAMTEFALSLPLVLTAGLYGTETAHLALTHMKVSQVAMHLADNASRIGDTSTITNRKIFESDINDLLLGSSIQAGRSLNFYEHGRAIISSLEVFSEAMSCAGGGCPMGNKSEGTQFIHWQRCKGKKVHASTYGDEYDSKPSGMGPSGQEITADSGSAVIFVEVAYNYQPLISQRFFGPTTITAISTFTQRNNIDLTGLKQRKPLSPDAVSDCGLHTGFAPITV